MTGFYIKQGLLMIGGFIVGAIALPQFPLGTAMGPTAWLGGGVCGLIVGWVLSGDPPPK